MNIFRHRWFFAVGCFFVRAKQQKIFSGIFILFFLKNDFVDNILRHRIFYVETNGALVSMFFFFFTIVNMIFFFKVVNMKNTVSMKKTRSMESLDQ
jgi:hypothetical protein